MKEESVKARILLNMKETKIILKGNRKIGREEVETVTDIFFLGSKIQEW